MVFTNDAEVRSKADFRIFLENGSLVIEDGDGNRGGNVLSRGSRKISWLNDTGGTCHLVYRQLLADEQEGAGTATWPFDPDQSPWSNERVIPPALTVGANPWVGKLATVTSLVCVKYDVMVHMGDGTVYGLDPIIIVRP